MLSRIFSFSFIDSQGIPLDGGMMFTYAAGTTVPATTYYDETGTLNTNPVILDSRGCASFYVDNAVEYLFVLKDRNGNEVWSADHVTANTRTFSAVGSDTIEATEEVVEGRTVVTFRVKPNSVGRTELKNPRELIVDAETMEMVAKDIGGKKYIVLKSKGGGGGASEEYVDAKVAAEAQARVYEDELLRQSIPTKTSQLQNDSGFLKTNGILSSRIPVYFNTFTKYYQSIDNDNLSTRLSGFIDQSLRLIVIATSVKITTPNFSPVYATSDGCGLPSWPAVGFIDIPGFVANNRIASYIQMFESYNEAKGYPAGIIIDQGSSRLALVVNSDCKLNSNGNNDTWYNFPPVSIMY